MTGTKPEAACAARPREVAGARADNTVSPRRDQPGPELDRGGPGTRCAGQRAVGLVYAAARAPDAGEDYAALAARFPAPPANAGLVFTGGFGGSPRTRS
jgi:hypothetical protein